ncbi:MAG: DUF2384 domain-containing protein [Proteobacteria bacterium]|nr:MAG: DUF2384 domain-containing protein [Pseudomonadota bacterium]
MTARVRERPDAAATLTKALLNAGREMGLSQQDIGEVVGRNRSSLHRHGVEPDGKTGELALLLVRVYRSLYVLVGGAREDMRHFMKTPNRHTGGVPAEQVKTVAGLVRVVEYLDAIRAKN